MANVSVKEFQSPLVRLIPRLIDWLNSVEGWVIAPLFNEAIDSVLGPQKVLKVDKVVALAIPGTHPLTSLDLPVSEVVLVRPGQASLLTGVVKSILAAFDGMHVQKHFDANFSKLVHGPFDLL